MPTIDPERDACDWPLSAHGRAQCRDIAAAIAAFRPARVVSSDELKAVQTAAEIAQHLGLECVGLAGLGEQDRRGAPFFKQPGEFERAVAAVFARPDDIVFGGESGTAARVRFATALDRLIASADAETLVVVSHGTVMSLLLGERSGIDALSLWRQLRLGSIVVVRLPTWEIEQIKHIPATD